jgi:hypothetical protein
LPADPYNPGNGQHFYNANFNMNDPQNAQAAAQPVNTTTGMNLGQATPQDLSVFSGNGGGVMGGGLGEDTLLSPWTQQFTPPNYQQIQDDPNFQFQKEQGLQGVERGAASKGTLLTGGTLKALDAYGTGLANTFANDYYNKAMNEYLLQKQNFQENQDRPFTKLSSLASLGKPSTAV